MKRFSEKVFLSLTMPTEEVSIGDQQRWVSSDMKT